MNLEADYMLQAVLNEVYIFRISIIEECLLVFKLER